MEKIKKFMRNLWKNKAWLLMVLPGTIWLLIFSYLPMFGLVIAFKDFRISPGGFVQSLINSDWVGFKNFEFLFSSGDAMRITRNTVVYNLVFIILGLIFAVTIAITLSQLANKKLRKVYQTGMLFPHFLSWVIVSYFLFSFLSFDKGMVNSVLSTFGVDPISWYNEPKYWPFILVFINIWKGVGYGSIVYLAAIVGIDTTYYEAATIDGASKWQQIKHITIPLIVPLMIILTIMAIGGIFRADFGLFYQVPKNSAILYPVTDVIDTYIYKGLMNMGNIGMSTAAGLYQAVVGFILIMVTNFAVKKIDPEYGLF
ncbi:MAG: ABC transporter permease [Romboutsia sp.]|uniref:ABC transporter permease n=1 Tax=Romboutsia sp. TaxID=1965302 RepID=UPI003F2D9844